MKKIGLASIFILGFLIYRLGYEQGQIQTLHIAYEVYKKNASPGRLIK
jgi:hypothetical protein